MAVAQLAHSIVLHLRSVAVRGIAVLVLARRIRVRVLRDQRALTLAFPTVLARSSAGRRDGLYADVLARTAARLLLSHSSGLDDSR